MKTKLTIFAVTAVVATSLGVSFAEAAPRHRTLGVGVHGAGAGARGVGVARHPAAHPAGRGTVGVGVHGAGRGRRGPGL